MYNININMQVYQYIYIYIFRNKYTKYWKLKLFFFLRNLESWNLIEYYYSKKKKKKVLFQKLIN